MPGSCVPKFAPVCIEHAVKSSCKKNSVSLPEDLGKLGVEVGHEHAGISGIGSAAFDESAQHRGNERGANAVSHYVTNKDTGGGVGEADSVEKVATNKAGCDITVVEVREAATRLAQRERLCLWHHCLL